MGIDFLAFIMGSIKLSVQLGVLLGVLGFALAQDQSKYFGGSDEAFDRCQVGNFARVLCGDPGIDGADCEALNCCFDQQCYYANEVVVHCLRDARFMVVVSRAATLPMLDLGSVNLLDNQTGGSCGPVSASPGFLVFQFPVTACGTTVMVQGDYVVYENRVTSTYEVAVGPLGSITRDSVFALDFQCWYHGSEVLSLVAEVNTVPPPLPVAAPGPLRVELRLASGQCDAKGKGVKGCSDAEAYSDYYRDADYPVTRVLREPVYVEVRILERTDPNIVLLLEDCWATSTSSPVSLPQWSLLVAGCPYHDDRYQTTLVPVDGSSGLPFPTHYKRFIVQMFTFVDAASFVPLKEMVYIHCSTQVCHPSATDRCEQRCLGGKQRRSVPVARHSSEEHVVSSKAVMLTSSEPTVSDWRLDGEVTQSGVGPGLLGAAACVVLVATLALAVACLKRSHMEPKV
uniref:Zona pellucida sperm-binding protein 4 n=1 Tax=Ophichthidae sp. und TaxID=2067718 RepID=A0A7R6VNI8_9TELE|nr:egg envelope protein [Ophichthidae sp. und]